MRREYADAVGVRLRAVRVQQGLSLQAVESKSGGRWKTAAVGSYERGDRMLSAVALCELAAFYQVPVAALLPERDVAIVREQGPCTVLDLARLAEAPTDAELLRRWAEQIRWQRGDYAGRVLSIRGSDLNALAVLYSIPPAQITERIHAWNVLVETNQPEPDVEEPT